MSTGLLNISGAENCERSPFQGAFLYAKTVRLITTINHYPSFEGFFFYRASQWIGIS